MTPATRGGFLAVVAAALALAVALAKRRFRPTPDTTTWHPLES